MHWVNNKMRCLCFGFLLVLMGCVSVWANDTFDDVQILERDVARIKATGDLRGGEKLMKVVVRLRDADVMIMGNDYRYGYLTLIPYATIQTMTYSDIGGHLPDQLHRTSPLYEANFDGQDQRWFAITYEQDEKMVDVRLMLGKETADNFIKTLAGHAPKTIGQYVDGVPRFGDDVAFRDCRVFRTISDDGKPKTDDFACLVMMRTDAFEVVGQDKNYQERFLVPYAVVRRLSYEHSNATSYMGRMPGIGAFRKAKHWFVIEGDETVALMLAPEIVADFREMAQGKSGMTINAYADEHKLQASAQAASLPQELGIPHSDEETLQVLMSAKTIRCLLGPGTRALWADGQLTRDGDARYDVSQVLVLDAIDLAKQTARLRSDEKVTPVRVVASRKGLTFLAVDDATLVITVFARNDGQLVCVYSQHVTDDSPQASQFYGVVEVGTEP
jgi:hypothetical protein